LIDNTTFLQLEKTDVEDKLIKCGIDAVGNISWGTHFCQFYQTKEDLIEILVPYFRAGLENSEFCMWIISESLSKEEAKAALRKAVPDFDFYLERGQIEILPYTYLYIKDGIFDSQRVLKGWVEKLNNALDNGYQGLRLAGSIFWLEKKDWSNFVNSEEEINQVIENSRIISLCTCCLDKCNANEIIYLMSNHQFALIKKEGKWEQIESSCQKDAVKLKQTGKSLETLCYSEAQLRVLVQNVKSGVALIDEGGSFAVVNPSFMQMFGLDSELDILNVNSQDWSQWEVYGEDGKLLHVDEHPVRKAVISGKPVKDQLVAVKNPGANELTWMLVSAEPVIKEDGQIYRVICTYHDITGQKKSEEALQEAYEELQIQSEELQAQSEEIQAQNEELQAQTEELQKANEALSKSEKRFELLSEANALLLSSKNPEAIIQTIAEKVMYHLNCDVFFNYVFDEAKGRLHLNAYSGVSKEVAEEIEWLDKGVAICGCVARDGCRIVSEDIQYNGDMRAELVRAMGVQAYACQPLHMGGETIGTLSFGVKSKNYFSEDKLALISTVADQISVAIEHKRAEETLQRERSLLQSVMQTTDFMLAFFDPHFNFVWVNPAYAESCNMGPEELIGKNHFVLFPHEENEAIFRKVRETGKEIFYKDKPFIYPDQPERGVTYWDWNLAPVKNSSRNVTGLVLSLHETTKYKQAHEALEEKESIRKVAEAIETERKKLFSILETLPVMVCLLTPDYHVVFANFAFREKFGESEGRHCYEYCYGLSKPCKFCETYKTLETGQPHHWEFTALDGSIIDAYDYPFTDIDSSSLILKMKIDITERRKAEEVLAKIDEARIKEIHHRIKNNLQVISSLLDLQAERFSDIKVLNAFKESQNRVVSMALIHEELYKGKAPDTLDFAVYLQKLSSNLLNSYNLKNNGISLKLDLEQVFLDMDIAIPLGIIVNELISNSLKHAFPGSKTGKISISLYEIEYFIEGNKKDPAENLSGFEGSSSAGFTEDLDFRYKLIVSDDGRGIPEEIDIQNIDSLGLQLVNILVEQIDGDIELRRDKGTEFAIWFNNKEL
jgi:PAS domain S-box-containing protein